MSRSIVKACPVLFSFSLLLARLYLRILWSVTTQTEMRRGPRPGLPKYFLGFKFVTLSPLFLL